MPAVPGFTPFFRTQHTTLQDSLQIHLTQAPEPISQMGKLSQVETAETWSQQAGLPIPAPTWVLWANPTCV